MGQYEDNHEDLTVFFNRCKQNFNLSEREQAEMLINITDSINNGPTIKDKVYKSVTIATGVTVLLFVSYFAIDLIIETNTTHPKQNTNIIDENEGTEEPGDEMIDEKEEIDFTEYEADIDKQMESLYEEITEDHHPMMRPIKPLSHEGRLSYPVTLKDAIEFLNYTIFVPEISAIPEDIREEVSIQLNHPHDYWENIDEVEYDITKTSWLNIIFGYSTEGIQINQFYPQNNEEMDEDKYFYNTDDKVVYFNDIRVRYYHMEDEFSNVYTYLVTKKEGTYITIQAIGQTEEDILNIAESMLRN